VTLGLGSLPPDRLKYASGLFNMMRNLGGAIGIALCATILNDRTNLHYERLAERLNSSNAAFQATLAKLEEKFALNFNGDFSRGHDVALQTVQSLTHREAQVESFADAFFAIGIALALAALLTPLLKKVAPTAAPDPGGH